METELLRERLLFCPCALHTLIFVCVCMRVPACVRLRSHKTIYLFVLYRTARSKMYSTVCVRYFTFSNKIKTREIIFSLKHFYFHSLTPVFGNCAAFLCGRFQELHRCCREATSRTFFTEWHELNCLMPFILKNRVFVKPRDYPPIPMVGYFCRFD